MTEIETMFKAFALGQKVRVVGTEIDALVQQINYGMEGCQYQISYWHENVRRVEWVFPSEIEKAIN